MQIADISKILKNLQRDFTFMFHAVSESRIGFVFFFGFLSTTKILLVSPKFVFIENEAT